MRAFFRLEAAGGLVLVAASLVALSWANSQFAPSYDALFREARPFEGAGIEIEWTLQHVVNDALMTLFFAVAGLEIKRELVRGELRTRRQAALPLIAALGGMLVPAGIYLALNPSGPERAGWGVPVATDIAFALGCLSLVKSRVPPSLFAFLTALAIFDDVGAIVVIALFYGGGVSVPWLAAAAAIAFGLVAVGRAGVERLLPYAALGVLLWAALLGSGVHPTLAGVAFGVCVPASSSNSGPSPLDRAMHALHAVVTFGIVPLFGLANAGVALGGAGGFGSSVTLGAFAGLIAGKPLGVGMATLLAVKWGFAPKPPGATTLTILGVSCLAGIGFTMSLLVGSLAFEGARELEEASKLGVLSASLGSALLGLGLLSLSRKGEARG